jgi:archaellum biogenesis ATPase FlaH
MLTLLHARDKVGKTLLAWEMSRAILRNVLFCGEFRVDSGRVVLALLDDPTDLTVSRRDALGLNDCDNLRIVTPTDADLSEPEKFLADFHNVCSEFKPHLIVIDSLYKFAPQGENSMNDTARMGRLMSKFDALAEDLQAAVLLIAHDRKDGSDVAGSHVIRATAKAILHLTKTQRGNDGEEEDDGTRLLTVETKMTAEARFLFRCQGVNKWEYLGRADSASQTRLTKARAAIRSFLATGATGTVKVIAKLLKIREGDARAVLEQMEEEGVAKSEMTAPTGSSRGRKQRVYEAAGLLIPKGGNGLEIQPPLEPASNAACARPTPLQPALDLAGSKFPPQKAANNAGSSDKPVDALVCN